MKGRFHRGTVVCSKFPEAIYPKYFVIAGLSTDTKTVYGFFINSELNRKAYNNNKTKCTQIKIVPNSYVYLDYSNKPSYIDCYQYKEISFTTLINALIESPTKICEPSLSEQHIKEVVEAIQKCKKFSSDEKDIVLREFTLPEF